MNSAANGAVSSVDNGSYMSVKPLKTLMLQRDLVCLCTSLFIFTLLNLQFQLCLTFM